MQDLKISKGYVVYPGRETYSLGNHVTAIPAVELLGDPQRVAEL